MLCIMDGFGWTPDETYGNAVAAANKPNLDKIFANYLVVTHTRSSCTSITRCSECDLLLQKQLQQ